MTTVINLRGHRDDPEFDPALNENVVYLGRSVWWGAGRRLAGHPLANRFSARKYGRDSALAFYRQWLATVPNLAEVLEPLRGKVLACWCVEPDRNIGCHASIVAEEIDKRWGGTP